MGAKETGKDNENKIGNIKEDGTIVDDMKIDEQDIKKKKSSGEIKKKKGKNSVKKDLKEEDIDKKVDIIKEDGEGQLISKCPFGVTKSTKKLTKCL